MPFENLNIIDIQDDIEHEYLRTKMLLLTKKKKFIIGVQHASQSLRVKKSWGIISKRNILEDQSWLDSPHNIVQGRSPDKTCLLDQSLLLCYENLIKLKLKLNGATPKNESKDK